MDNKIKNAVTDFWGTVIYCFKLSYKASAFYTVFRMVARIFFAIITIVSTYIMSRLMEVLAGASGGKESGSVIVGLFIFILITGVAIKVVNEINQYCTGMHNIILSNYLNIYTMEKSVTADVEYFDSPVFYDAIESVRRDNYAIVNIMWNVIDGSSSIITFLSTFIIISRKNFWFAFLVILTIIPSAIVNKKYTKYIYNWELEHIKEQRRMGYLQHVASSREHVMDVRLFDIGDYLIQKYKTIWKVFYDMRKVIVKKRTFLVLVTSLMPESCLTGIMLIMALGILAGKDTIGDYTLYTGLLSQLSASVLMMVDVCMNIYEDRLRINNVKNFERFLVKVPDEGKRTISNSEEISIEFRNVSFSYPETKQVALDNVSFKVNSREKVCIVGLNGAGKSTIMKLILRFYDVSCGKILINDFDIKEYDIKELRKCFNIFFQNVTNYSFTLRENITISDIWNQDRGDDDIYDALRHSDAFEMAKKFPGGLGQYITKSFDEDGVELSGGQYQKIALARMFYRKSKVVLLDEPSATLDPEAEHRLFRYLEEYCEGKTTIFTSHRLSNVHLADYIILIEAGKLLEYGTHEELISRNKRYAQLYRYQAEKFTE